MLTNREITGVFLFGGFVLVMCVWQRDVRSSVGQLLRTIFASKLLILWLLYAATITGAVIGEMNIGLHYHGSVKDAVVWAVIAGLPLLGRFDAVSKDPELLGRMLLDAVKVTTFVEAFVNLYVFPLWVEIPGQAFVALVAMSSVVARTDEANRPAKRLLDGVLVVIGLTAITWTAWHIASNWSELDLRATGLSIVQPVVLTLAVLALTAVVSLVSAYELAFVRLQYPLGAPEVRWRHRIALLVGLHVRVVKVSGFAGALSVRLRKTTSWRGALAVLREYKRGRIDKTDWPGMDDDDEDEAAAGQHAVAP